MKLAQKLKVAEDLAHLLDNKFGIGPFRFGLDPIIGFVPVLGDLIPLAMSGYLLTIAVQEKVRQPIINRMILNLVADFVIGTVPVVGDVADFFYQAHMKNLQLLKEELARMERKR